MTGVLITVNSNVTYQTIFGFGGAMTDSAALKIMSLSAGAREKLMSSYFSEQGTEYDFLRVPIAGTDFSTRTYTYNDEEYDIALKNFQLADEDINYKVNLSTRRDRSPKRINLNLIIADSANQKSVGIEPQEDETPRRCMDGTTVDENKQ